MANPILAGDVLRLNTASSVAASDYFLVTKASTRGPVQKATAINAIRGGVEGSVGTFTATGATPVTVSNTAVTANSIIVFTLKTVGGTVGAYPAIQTITPSTGFTVACTALDTSVYNYVIL